MNYDQTSFITLNKIFDQLIPNSFGRVNQTFRQSFPYPYNVDVYYHKDNKEIINAVLQFALAGIEKEQISVFFDQEKYTVTIKVQKDPNEPIYTTDEQVYTVTKGISHRDGEVTFKLLNQFDIDNNKVTYRDGMLTVNIPGKKRDKDNIIQSIIED